ncbi:hypothetical protein FWF93_00045 [Candidatus Saccharibacteria bacterium]|nr:hypothetical protein [Candidatus Saccharibacteria bacterium]
MKNSKKNTRILAVVATAILLVVVGSVTACGMLGNSSVDDGGIVGGTTGNENGGTTSGSNQNSSGYDRMIVSYGQVDGNQSNGGLEDQSHVVLDADLYMRYVQEYFRDPDLGPNGYNGQPLTLVSTGTSSQRLINCNVAPYSSAEGLYVFAPADYRNVVITFDGDVNLFDRGPIGVWYFTGSGIISHDEAITISRS